MTAQNRCNGPDFFAMLGVALIVLKLCGVIGCSWWWVLAPIWGPAVMCILIALASATGYLSRR